MLQPIAQMQVQFIKQCLRRGESRISTLNKFLKRWPGSTKNTFTRRAKAAAQALLPEMAMVKHDVKQAVQGKTRFRKIEILSIIQRMEILSKIAKGDISLRKPILVKGKVEYVKVSPSWTDRRNAIAELNKMDGAYIPIKPDTNPNRLMVFEIGN